MPVASSDSFIISYSDQLVKNFFEVFLKLFGTLQRPAIQGLLSCFVAVSVSDLYYITRVGGDCQHLFLKKVKSAEKLQFIDVLTRLNLFVTAQFGQRW